MKFLSPSLIMVLLAILFALSSCKKETTTLYVKDNSILSRFTSKQWIYDSVYTNYTKSSQGTLVYVRGRNNNLIDYGGDSRFIFWSDGTQDSFGGGAHYLFQWSFTNSDSTNLIIQNPAIDYARILHLDSNYLTLYDSTNKALCYCTVKP